MNAIKLALLELRRFRGHPLRYAALIVILLIPLLYGGLYLWFSWDPYGQTDHMPVAVVNHDEGAELEGEDVNGGQQLVDQLDTARVMDWHFVDQAEADRGLEDGDYYLILEVPADFSESLTSLASSDPEQTHISITTNDANNYVAGIMAQTLELELQNQINTAVYVTFAKSAIGDIHELKIGLETAADGADDLHTGASDASTGASELHSGLEELTTGAEQVAAGVGELTDTLLPVLETLSSEWPNIQSASDDAATLTNRVATDLDDVYDELCTEEDVDGCDTLDDILTEAQDINDDVQTANNTVQGISPTDIDDQAGDLQELRDGSNELHTGLQEATTGAAELDTGLAELTDGTDELAGELHNAADQIPSVDPADNADNADVYGNPVTMQDENLNPAGNYGKGMAPFFLAIALWVFGLVAFKLLRTYNPRALAGRLNALSVAATGWIPAAILASGAAIILYLTVDLSLGLNPDNRAGTIGILLLTAWVFAAITHLFRLALGSSGEVLILVGLMLQLTSAGGLFPVETTPGFFQALHPYMPMTYAVDALRVTITGGNPDILTYSAMMLSLFGVGALALSTLVAAKFRTWDIDRLKPGVAT